MKKLIALLITFALLVSLVPFNVSADSGGTITQPTPMVSPSPTAEPTPSAPAVSPSSSPDPNPDCDYIPQFFVDVDSSHWAYDAIEYVGYNGLMQGMGNSKFNPSGGTTRAQLVAILYRLEGKPTVSSMNSFSDVTASWAKAPVEWAASRGIVTGKGNSRFDPNGDVTRQEFAAILARYARYKGIDTAGAGSTLNEFPDTGHVDSWAFDDLCWAKEAGLITGKGTASGQELDPKGYASRAQTAVILQRFITVLETVPDPIPVEYKLNGQTVFTISVPRNWQDDFAVRSNEEEIPWLSFYDKRNHEGPEAMGGRLFGVFLDTETECHLPSYRNWGEIRYNGQKYTLRFYYPTDVQCGSTPELIESYHIKYTQVGGIFDNGIQLAEGVSKLG